MNIMFELSRDPFQDDLAVQFARMALAVSMEHKVTMVCKGEASVLAMQRFPIPVRELDYFDHDRFLEEQELEMYIPTHDVSSTKGEIRACFREADQPFLTELYAQQDVIFRN